MTARRIQYFAVAAALITAVLYVAMGIALQAEEGMLQFGLMAGGSFVVVALLLAFVRRRIAWIPVAVYQLAVLGMYVAMADIREPAYEIWGLAIKAFQVLILGTTVYLTVRADRITAASQRGASAAASAR